jgi:hypothetical protein
MDIEHEIPRVTRYSAANMTKPGLRNWSSVFAHVAPNSPA